MMTPEFNLLDEPWIRVIDEAGVIREVSLTDALLHAHEYTDLRGEMATQDVAVLRLLLAILHTVVSRVDEKGDKATIELPRDARNRWRALWELGRFPQRPIRDYLETWHERFWLFHEERPFWQVPEAKNGTGYTSAKLNGELSESSNKLRLFPVSTGRARTELSYAEAARWLLYVNAYDDTSAKPKEKGLPSPGVGWLGRLGFISVVGNNLFETLLLNLTLLKDGGEQWEEENLPVWEREEPRRAERTEIAVPSNQAELLTLQSRRLLLYRRNGIVTGYSLLGGDFFSKVGAFSEQMTVWATIPQKGDNAVEYQPRRHDPSRQMWRDFGAVFVAKPGVHQPGVVRWYSYLAGMMNWPATAMSYFRIASVQYGDKDFFVNDTFSDSLAFHAGLLTQLGNTWQMRIQDEIGLCEELAFAVGQLERNLAKAASGEGDGSLAREQFYDRLDQPFRRWLRSVDPALDGEKADDKRRQWRDEAGAIARRLGREMVDRAGESAFVGRKVREKKSGMETERYYCAPEAFNWLNLRIHQICQ